jgi:indoleamine 2,3-dioxygenase
MPTPAIRLADFEVSAERGFLPGADPLAAPPADAPAGIVRMAALRAELPKRLLTGTVRASIDALAANAFELGGVAAAGDTPALRFAMADLSFLAHAYVWGGPSPSPRLPAVIAKPWVAAAGALGRPPILSYASYCLDNWRRLDVKKPIGLDNVALIRNFLGGVDEDWFVTIHVCIEAAAGPGLAAAARLVELAEVGARDATAMGKALVALAASLREVNAVFARMPERCDPYVYYHRVRPFIFGTKDNPDLPEGLVYEGAFGDAPQMLRGETGAQSSIVPSIDGALGVAHEHDELRGYLNEMREYMPPRHRVFMESLETRSRVRAAVAATAALRPAYDACLEELRAFRTRHMEYAATYITRQKKTASLVGSGGSTIWGTGGTPFAPYLKKHRDETEKGKLEGGGNQGD